MGDYKYFNRDFIQRTLVILQQYDTYVMPKIGKNEQYEITLLVNCLIGLLALPHEKNLLDRYESELVKDLKDWGVELVFIANFGGYKLSRNQPFVAYAKDTLDLGGLVRQLRNGLAHIGFKSSRQNDEITHLIFKDRSGFEAEFPIANLRVFATKLAQSVLDNLPKNHNNP